MTRVDASHRIKSVAVMPAKMVPVNLIAKSAASVPPAFTSVFDVYLAHCFDGTPPIDPDGYQDVDPVFPTLNHQERARDIINNGWDAVVGVKIRCVPEKDYAALAGLGAWAFAMRAAQDWSMASEEDRRKGTGAGGEGSGAARMTPKRCRSLAIRSASSAHVSRKASRPLSGPSALTQTARWRSSVSRM